MNDDLDSEMSRIILEAVFDYIGATNAKDAHLKYVELDQPLFASHDWDYDNPEQPIHIIVRALERIRPEHLTADEQPWVQETVWFWYHHAISVALWWKKDIELAKKFAAKAAELQDPENNNRITRVLFYLINKDFIAAERYINESVGHKDYDLACDMLASFRRGEFFEGKF